MQSLKELLLRDVIDPIHNPQRFEEYGLTIPNGILLFGPPGCGKTYIARQLAEELGHFFIEMIPSEIASPYIHSTVLRVREIFDSAAERAPSILFIDEFEALVPARSELGGFQQYKAEEVNEFLAQLNGCASKQVFVIAATNEPAKIDPAIRRSGRLDKLIYVGPPDNEARGAMLTHHLRGRPCESSLDIGRVATELNGYSASDLKLVVDEAARLALEKAELIGMEHIRTAAARVPPSVSEADEQKYRGFTERGR
jgi:transitional endoplasmic reticulum ATPase